MTSTDKRIHQAVSCDEIAGRVNGQGPPLVFIHGGLGDGGSTWRFLTPFLDGFSCYLMSTRGRGLRADSPDHSLERLLEVITAFAESIGDLVGLAGLSRGAIMGLAAASRTMAISAVAAYEAVLVAAAREDTGQADPSLSSRLPRRVAWTTRSRSSSKRAVCLMRMR